MAEIIFTLVFLIFLKSQWLSFSITYVILSFLLQSYQIVQPL